MQASSHREKFQATQERVLVVLGLLLPFVLCWAQPASGLPPKLKSMTPNSVMRGSLVTISGTDFPASDPSQIKVILTSAEGTPPLTLPPPSSADPTSFVFTIPLWDAPGCNKTKDQVDSPVPCQLPLGTYAVEVRFEALSPPVVLASGLLQLVSSAGNDVKITAVFPLVSYPDNDTFSFKILGQGFSKMPPEDNILVVDNIAEPSVTWLRGELPVEKNRKHDKLYGWVGSSRELTFWGLPAKDMPGKANLRVRIGERLSEPSPIMLAQASPWAPLGWAVGSLAVIAGCLFGLIQSGVHVYRVADKTYNLAQAFFIDPETDTYSLSKFQFYWWTALAIFGYVYLTIARSLIQGVVEFAPLPTGLLGILLVSTGTKVLARGITNLKGTKGSGDIHPSFADFVTVGGIVSAERAQFFVWTLIGGMGFLFLVLASDPGNVQALPSLPDSFVAIMGISSVGYLGGKVVRKAGPVITGVTPRTENGRLSVEIHGRSLSRHAGLRIDTDNIAPMGLFDTPSPDDIGLLYKPQPEDKDNQTQEPDMYTVLRVDIANFANKQDAAWWQTEHALTVTNPDGQMSSSWPFTVHRDNASSLPPVNQAEAH